MYLSYDLLKNLIYFHDRINNLFEEKLKSIYSASEMGEGTVWSPAVDIYETDGEFFLTAEVPGVELNDIFIKVMDNELVLTGSRPFPRAGVKREDYQRLEGSYGSFARRFTLPMAVASDHIKAKLKDGVLCVVIPKAGEHRVTAIPIEDK